MFARVCIYISLCICLSIWYYPPFIYHCICSYTAIPVGTWVLIVRERGQNEQRMERRWRKRRKKNRIVFPLYIPYGTLTNYAARDAAGRDWAAEKREE